jgi:hypothetical protein
MPGYIESYVNQQHQYPPLAERKVAMFDEGKHYADHFLNRTVAHRFEMDPPANNSQKLDVLRDSARDLRREIQVGQTHYGSAWQDPDFTRGARYELNHRYLQIKWELGLTHLPELGQKLQREHGRERGMEHGLSV